VSRRDATWRRLRATPARLAAALVCVVALSDARADQAIERVQFPVTGAFEPGTVVSGELRIPRSGEPRLPAVLILHGSAGIDGRGASYATVLNQAGFATFEIDLFQGRGRPATTRHNMPHVFQSLQRLAADPRIDSARIGVVGFSWGGIIAVLTSSEELREQFAGRAKFAAHLGIYPVCWSHRSILAGAARHFRPSVYGRVSGSPVHLLAGDKDDYDEPGACASFLQELPAEVRSHFALTVYPGATHGWDGPAGGAYYDIGANSGKGGTVTVIANPEVAARSRDFAVAFFSRHLGAAGR
jgi:dienelactone hydrolase